MRGQDKMQLFSLYKKHLKKLKKTWKKDKRISQKKRRVENNQP